MARAEAREEERGGRRGGERVELRCGGERGDEGGGGTKRVEGDQPSTSTSAINRSSTNDNNSSSSYLYPNPLLSPPSPTSLRTPPNQDHGCNALLITLPSLSNSSVTSPIELVFTRTEHDDPRSGDLRVKRRVSEVEKVFGVRGQEGGGGGGGGMVGFGLGGKGGGKTTMGCGCVREEVGCLGW